MKKDFYYDIFSLKNCSIKNWSENFFWPVHFSKTQQILHKIINLNKKFIKQNKDFETSACLSIYQYDTNPYVILFNYLLLKQKISDLNMNIIHSEYSKVMNYIMRESSDFPIKLTNFSEYNENNPLFRNLKDKFKTIFFNLKYLKFSNKNKTICINNKNILTNDYVIKSKDRLSVISVSNLLKNLSKTKINELKVEKINSVLVRIHKECIKLAREKLRIHVPEFVQNDILNFQKKNLRSIFSVLTCLSENKNLLNCDRVLVDAPKPIIKAIGLVVNKNKGNVTSLLHGDWMAHSLSKRPQMYEFLISDELVLENQSQLNLFQQIYAKYPPINKKNLKFIVNENDKFQKMKKMYSFKVVKKIKSVMILELQLWLDTVKYELPETMILYEFYFRLISFFNKLGYKVFFKKRPKSRKIENFDFFKNINNFEIIEGDIKEPNVMNLADVIIFQYGLSSTFVPLMCSNKRLIYVDSGFENWQKGVYSALKRRSEPLSIKEIS